jgi:tRNA A22 N-methylase
VAIWQRELDRAQVVLRQVQSAHEVPAEKVAELETKISEIKEVLQRVGA